MKIISKLADLQRCLSSLPPAQRPIGLVPTMGALHAGHGSLIHRARRETKTVVASIFVNPTQFRPGEDFQRYPRPRAADVAFLTRNRVSFLFAPRRNSMYPDDHDTDVRVHRLTQTLCGAPRSRGPAHFVGVATVVAKLFNLVRPERAYFGMKDFQQLRVIEQMNRDLNFGIRIVRCPTVREPDGLAMSSRNAYLSSDSRRAAPGLYRALQRGRKLLRSRSASNLRSVRQTIVSLLKAIPNSKLEYLELVDSETLQPVQRKSGAVLIAAAVRLGDVRLIDNVLVS